MSKTVGLHGLAEQAEAPKSRVGTLLGRQARPWRQRLVVLTLISSDVLLALLVWGAAFIVQSVWGRGALSAVSAVGIAPNFGVWVGLRAYEILRVPPRITGPWQVAGRKESYFSDRVRMDVHYVRNWSV